MQFVDTNIFIRYFTNDHPTRAKACYLLFQKAKRNQIKISTTEAVIAEVVYVLSSKKTYRLPREQIRALLYPLLTVKGLMLPQRKLYLVALDQYVTYPVLDFEDALTIAYMKRKKEAEVASYDTGFDRVPGVTRVEP